MERLGFGILYVLSKGSRHVEMAVRYVVGLISVLVRETL